MPLSAKLPKLMAWYATADLVVFVLNDDRRPFIVENPEGIYAFSFNYINDTQLMYNAHKCKSTIKYMNGPTIMFHRMDTFWWVRDINSLPCAGVISFGICSSTIFVSLSLSRKPGVIAPNRSVFNSCANAYIIFNPSWKYSVRKYEKSRIFIGFLCCDCNMQYLWIRSFRTARCGFGSL